MKRLISLVACMLIAVGIMAQGKNSYVDLGLSSGTLWATCNVGAKSPEQPGFYLGWGETEPHFYKGKWSKPEEGYEGYCWSNYKLCNHSYIQLTKYCCQEERGYDGFTDYRVLLNPEDDAATANMGRHWNIPTEEQWQELIDECQWTWTNNYNNTSVAGYIVSNSYNNDSHISLSNKITHIFLPAAGFYDRKSFNQYGFTGDYWSSSLDINNSSFARFLSFHPGDNYIMVSNNRFYGISVRAVRSFGDEVSR